MKSIKRAAKEGELDRRATVANFATVQNEGELEEIPTIRKFRIVQAEGSRQVTREVGLYNLDVIISVGYRVKSHRGTQEEKDER